MKEVLASQHKILTLPGTTSNIDDTELAVRLESHLQAFKAWLAAQVNFSFLHVDYIVMLTNVRPSIKQINRYLYSLLNEAAMVWTVDPEL